MRRLLIGLVCLLSVNAQAHAFNAQELIHDQSSVISDPASIQEVLDELRTKTGVRLWLVTMPEFAQNNGNAQIDIEAGKMLQALDSKGGDEFGRGLLFLLLTEQKLVVLKSGPKLNLPQRKLGDIQKRVIIPRLYEDQVQLGLLNGCQALAHLVAGNMGVELSFAEVKMERGPRWWQRVPLEPRHLWLPALIVLWYLIVKIRKKRKNKDG